MKQLQVALNECNRVLKVFWSSTPLSKTHDRYLCLLHDLKHKAKETNKHGTKNRSN